ncbi:hypothetical protein G6F31_021412 [Rhizopus arrhizus]|nr:hypothetical protein G6F31_021412 [Rhizopus arrhizus]
MQRRAGAGPGVDLSVRAERASACCGRARLPRAGQRDRGATGDRQDPDHLEHPRQYPAARADGGRAVQQQCGGGKRLREAREMRSGPPDRQARQPGQPQGLL